MLRRVRLFKDGAGFVFHFVEGSLEDIERIPPSPGDHLLYDRIKELGLSESAEQLLNGEEVAVLPSRHKWPLP